MTKIIDRLIWIDLEMTGLSPSHDSIIEIATIITDNQLNIIETGPVIAIFQPDEKLDAMDDWNKQHHGSSGLIDRVKTSKFSSKEAEAITLEFLTSHLKANQSPMCGNSICQDRRFLAKEMPKLESFFHYRNLDVSTIKELAYRWYSDQSKIKFQKSNKHLALDDIKESIEELKFYKNKLFSAQID